MKQDTLQEIFLEILRNPINMFWFYCFSIFLYIFIYLYVLYLKTTDLHSKCIHHLNLFQSQENWLEVHHCIFKLNCNKYTMNGCPCASCFTLKIVFIKQS